MAEKTYTLTELGKLSDGYLGKLDPDDRDEMYTSERGFASIGVDGFLQFLAKREERAEKRRQKKSIAAPEQEKESE